MKLLLRQLIPDWILSFLFSPPSLLGNFHHILIFFPPFFHNHCDQISLRQAQHTETKKSWFQLFIPLLLQDVVLLCYVTVTSLVHRKISEIIHLILYFSLTVNAYCIWKYNIFLWQPGDYAGFIIASYFALAALTQLQLKSQKRKREETEARSINETSISELENYNHISWADSVVCQPCFNSASYWSLSGLRQSRSRSHRKQNCKSIPAVLHCVLWIVKLLYL